MEDIRVLADVHIWTRVNILLPIHIMWMWEHVLYKVGLGVCVCVLCRGLLVAASGSTEGGAQRGKKKHAKYTTQYYSKVVDKFIHLRPINTKHNKHAR